jgi:hypothetical protein
MSNFIFQWRDEKGIGRRVNVQTEDESKAWYEALNRCGWENRITLGIVGNDSKRQIRNGTIKNWWDAMSDPKLKRLNRLYLSGNIQDQLRSGFVKLVHA